MEESRPAAGGPRSVEECVVDWCTRAAAYKATVVNGWMTPTEHAFCKGHDTRWRRAGCPDRAEFVASQRSAKPFRHDMRRDIILVDMTRFPEPMRHELRFVIGEKVHRGEWSLSSDARLFLTRYAGSLPSAPTAVSFTDHPQQWWALRWATYCAQQGWETWHRRTGRGRLRSVLDFLYEQLDTRDPWDGDYWAPRRAASNDLVAKSDGAIDWRRVTIPWLNEAMRDYCRDCLRARTRAWSTVKVWAAAASTLNRFLVEEGLTEPSDVNRKVFLRYLHWVHVEYGSDTKREQVNVIANVLGDLRVNGYEERLPSEQLLRRGENPSRRVRAPKPIPPDVVVQIDRILDTAPELTRTQRRLFLLFRRGGPRPSEAALIPIDSLRVSPTGAYSVEYYMPKTENWRRFPIPDELGAELADQVRWVRATYGVAAAFMFPNERASAPAREGYPGRCVPHEVGGLRKKLRMLFDRHDLRDSSMTGEAYTGSQLHRFRHTIATELLNQDWTQYEVQLFLGHKSPTMMQHYAKINDDKLSQKYRAATSLVDKNGRPALLDDADLTLARMADRLKKAALPNGFCALPEQQTCSFRPNPCLDCSFFRTGKTFLGVHIQHRDELASVVESARCEGNQRVVELNEPMLNRLNELIPRIESASETDAVGVQS